MNYTKEIEDDGVLLVRNVFQEEARLLIKHVNRIIEENDLYNIEPSLNVNFEKLRSMGKPFFNKRISKRDGDEGLIDVWNFDQLVNDECREAIKKIDDFVLNIIEEAFKTKYSKKTVNLYVNNSVENTRGIHADSNFFPSRVKCFLYLTKVDGNDCGPFSFIKKSHTGAGLKYHRQYNIHTPLTEEDQDNYVIFNKLEIGDLVIAAVSGAHRGLPQKKGNERIALVISYDPR